ncbi:unnamed protein product [Amoebophrya sp. A25]|nr:unnamed protein product [Amoebophrya sp. A25]|eukprot:GSA25T00014857001.1
MVRPLIRRSRMQRLDVSADASGDVTAWDPSDFYSFLAANAYMEVPSFGEILDSEGVEVAEKEPSDEKSIIEKAKLRLLGLRTSDSDHKGGPHARRPGGKRSRAESTSAHLQSKPATSVLETGLGTGLERRQSSDEKTNENEGGTFLEQQEEGVCDNLFLGEKEHCEHCKEKYLNSALVNDQGLFDNCRKFPQCESAPESKKAACLHCGATYEDTSSPEYNACVHPQCETKSDKEKTECQCQKQYLTSTPPLASSSTRSLNQACLKCQNESDKLDCQWCNIKYKFAEAITSCRDYPMCELEQRMRKADCRAKNRKKQHVNRSSSSPVETADASLVAARSGTSLSKGSSSSGSTEASKKPQTCTVRIPPGFPDNELGGTAINLAATSEPVLGLSEAFRVEWSGVFNEFGKSEKKAMRNPQPLGPTQTKSEVGQLTYKDTDEFKTLVSETMEAALNNKGLANCKLSGLGPNQFARIAYMTMPAAAMDSMRDRVNGGERLADENVWPTFMSAAFAWCPEYNNAASTESQKAARTADPVEVMGKAGSAITPQSYSKLKQILRDSWKKYFQLELAGTGSKTPRYPKSNKVDPRGWISEVTEAAFLVHRQVEEHMKPKSLAKIQILAAAGYNAFAEVAFESLWKANEPQSTAQRKQHNPKIMEGPETFLLAEMTETGVAKDYLWSIFEKAANAFYNEKGWEIEDAGNAEKLSKENDPLTEAEAGPPSSEPATQAAGQEFAAEDVATPYPAGPPEPRCVDKSALDSVWKWLHEHWSDFFTRCSSRDADGSTSKEVEKVIHELGCQDEPCDKPVFFTIAMDKKFGDTTKKLVRSQAIEAGEAGEAPEGWPKKQLVALQSPEVLGRIAYDAMSTVALEQIVLPPGAEFETNTDEKGNANYLYTAFRDALHAISGTSNSKNVDSAETTLDKVKKAFRDYWSLLFLGREPISQYHAFFKGEPPEIPRGTFYRGSQPNMERVYEGMVAAGGWSQEKADGKKARDERENERRLAEGRRIISEREMVEAAKNSNSKPVAMTIFLKLRLKAVLDTVPGWKKLDMAELAAVAYDEMAIAAMRICAEGRLWNRERDGYGHPRNEVIRGGGSQITFHATDYEEPFWRKFSDAAARETDAGDIFGKKTHHETTMIAGVNDETGSKMFYDKQESWWNAASKAYSVATREDCADEQVAKQGPVTASSSTKRVNQAAAGLAQGAPALYDGAGGHKSEQQLNTEAAVGARRRSSTS